MKKRFNVIVIVLFCAVIFTIPVMTKLEPYSEYSFFENRNLASAPEFSVSDLFSGTYLPKWELYFSDHIAKRSHMMYLYTIFNLNILNRIVVNDIVISERRLLPLNPFNAPEQNYGDVAGNMANSLSDLSEFVKSYGGEFIYIGVPEQRSMFRELYPQLLENDNEELSKIETAFFSALLNRNVDFLNMRDVFLESGDYEKYYSSTDHHYNMFGAFYTYQTLIEKLNSDYDANLPCLTEADVNFIELPNPFYGSRSRRIYNLADISESLYYFTLNEPVLFSRTDNSVQRLDSVFSLPPDEYSNITYGVYLGGDVAETVIETNRPDLPNALIFGDSFTNPLETLLYTSFNETRSLDLRDYTEMTIYEYIKKYEPDYVFCLRDDTAYLSFDGNGNLVR